MEKRKDNKNRVLKEGEDQRPNGTYSYRYRDGNGKRIAVYAKTLEELRLKEVEVQKSLVSGTKCDSTLTVNDMFELWFRTKLNLRSSTLKNYKNFYTIHIKDSIGKVKISKVKKIDVVLFLQSLMQDKGLSYETARLINVVLKQVFELAVDNDFIKSNPTNNATKNLNKTKPSKQKALTVEQQNELEWYIHNSQYKPWAALIDTLLWTGMRIGEALGLTWNDVDFEANTISVNKTLTYIVAGGDKFEMHDPKTESGKRIIPMLPQVRAALIWERQRQTRSGTRCISGVDGYSDFVFFHQNGEILSPTTVNSALSRIVLKHNDTYGITRTLLPHMHNHTFRHTFSTRMCEYGVNPKAIQAVLGHSSIVLTMNVYTDASLPFVADQLTKLKPDAEKALYLSPDLIPYAGNL